MRTEIRSQRSEVRIGVTLCSLLFALYVSGHVFAQTKPVNGPSSPALAVKMPAEYSKQIDALQEQSKKLGTDYAQVITLYKDYVAGKT
jgi:hypothetical protein